MCHHLGGGNFRAYSLQLSKWDKRTSYNIVIQAVNLKSTGKGKFDTQLIELIEQRFWKHYQPVFGKKSGL